jgi:hypothetical protein
MTLFSTSPGLENDLKSVNRAVTPWVIFGGHRPMYINSNDNGSYNSDVEVMNLLIDNIEPLLYENNVNLAFWGHNHCVQRQSAVLNKTVVQTAKMVDGVAVHNNPQATVHMVIGTGGADFTFNNVYPPPEWNELVFHEWGYARVTVSSPNMLLWEWVNNTNGVVMDTMTITQSYPIKQWGTAQNTPQKSNLLRDAIIAVVCLIITACAVVAYFYYHRKHYESSDIKKPLNPKDIETENLNRIVSADEESNHASFNPIYR